MGKEQELLEAARSGNLSVVERVLSQKVKGPLASLRRGPSANTQDQSGYTSLHHSALNGHKDIVALLLSHKASTNIADNKGSTPLHLAAWTGNTEIVKLLLVHGPSETDVNHVNNDHETALHSAAQYGHTEVVNLLLQHNSDCTIRNLKNESALDLAAQYGRLETVQLLVKMHPELLQSSVKRHSPLHLASRNGHKQVVKVLLDAGFDVNYLTEDGSMLHEAALYGKMEVVRLLLEHGIDVNLGDSSGRTVFDLLDDLNTNIAKQIYRIIQDHSTLVNTEGDATPLSISPPPGFISGSSPLVPVKGDLSNSSPENPLYDTPPPAKPVNLSRLSSGSEYCPTPTSRDSVSSNRRSPLYDTPQSVREVDSVPFSTEFRSSSRSSRSSESDSVIREHPLPVLPGERHSGGSYQNVPLSLKDDRSDWTNSGTYIHMEPIGSVTGKPAPPVKPPRKSPVSKSQGSRYEYLCLASSGHGQPTATDLSRKKFSLVEEMCRSHYSYQQSSTNDYVDMQFRNSIAGNYENQEIVNAHIQQTDRHHNGVLIPPPLSTTDDRITESSFSALYDDIASGRITTFGNGMLNSKSTPSLLSARPTSMGKGDSLVSTAAKPSSLDLRVKRATVQIPLSPTHYEQPPTPDFPPPSPATAECGIHEKIRPLSQDVIEEELCIYDDVDLGTIDQYELGIYDEVDTPILRSSSVVEECED